MKKQFVILLLTICFTASAQIKNYYPSATNWEKKEPSSFRIDSALLNQAIQYALSHETRFPKNLQLTQAMQFGKEPFSDPIGPMAHYLQMYQTFFLLKEKYRLSCPIWKG